MQIRKAQLIYFSPTGTTQKVVHAIAQGFNPEAVSHLDLTPPEAVRLENRPRPYDLVILGVPVYAGRVPPDAKRRLAPINGNGAAAVLVVTYGNREYEDALLELRDIAIKSGFRPVAGGAFIGEHSYHSAEMPIAGGRPDVKDLEMALQFGRAIRQKISNLTKLDELPVLEVPGQFPYKEWGPSRLAAPVTDETVCTKCEQCAGVCPKAVITIGDTVMTRADDCIHCSACVKICPTGARRWEDSWIKDIAEWLSTNYYKRKEPETYL